MTVTPAPIFTMPEPPVLARLRVAGREVAQYRSGEGLDARLSPRPHLHPVRTLAGTAVTDSLPVDHRWHLGAGVAVQDVGGVNVWGGRTYRRGTGYVWLDDHGRAEHESFRTRSDTGFVAELLWRGPDGRELLRERREVAAAALHVPGPVSSPGPATPSDPALPVAQVRGWVLRLRFTLYNVTGARLELGSPGSNGREGGGYGGFFWRLPSLSDAEVRTADATGEAQVHGRPASWLAVQGRALGDNAEVTLVFRAADERTRQDPWFVRLATYPGIGSSLAWQQPAVLGAGESLTRAVDVGVADGIMAVDGLAGALAGLPPGDLGHDPSSTKEEDR